MKKEIEAKPSEMLERLIGIVNLVPPDLVLPTGEEIRERFAKLHKKHETVSQEDERENYLDFIYWSNDYIESAIIKDFPRLYNLLLDEYWMYLMPKSSEMSDSKKKSYWLRGSYEKFLMCRNSLREVAVAATNYTMQGYVQELFSFRGEIKQKSLGTNNTVFLEISDFSVPGYYPQIINGKFYPGLPPFLMALTGMGVSRLRICPVCDIIFWAYRADALTCSKQHGTVLRTRKWREGKKAHEEKLKNHFQPRKKK